MNTLRTALLFVFFLAMLYAHGQQDTVYQYRIEPLIKNNTRDRSPNKVYDYTGEIAGNYVTAKNSNGTSKKKVSFTGKFEVEVADLDWVYLLPGDIVLSIGKTKAFRDYQLMGREQLRDSMINYEFMKKTKEPSFKNYFVNYYNKHGELLKSYNYPTTSVINFWDIAENGNLVVTSYHDHKEHIYLFDKTGNPISEKSLDSMGVRDIRITNDGNMYAASIWNRKTQKHELYVCDQSGSMTFISSHSGFRPTFSFSSDSRYLIVRYVQSVNPFKNALKIFSTSSWKTIYENNDYGWDNLNIEYTDIIDDNVLLYLKTHNKIGDFFLLEMNTDKLLMKQSVNNIYTFRSRKMLPDKLKYKPETQVIELQLEDITHKFQLIKK